MFIIATLAAIVASQSLISATFSVIKQSVVLDYFPRVKVVHTSSSKEGEVYSPEVNYILMVLCVAVILIFGDGKDIGNAFGMTIKLHPWIFFLEVKFPVASLMMFSVDYWSNSLHSHVIDLEFFRLIASSIGNITLYYYLCLF